jgi:GT2 family glycosyltransferase
LPREVFSVKGAAMMIRRESLNVIGTFDSDFRALNEETDLCWRSWLCGYRVVFFPDSIVYHKGGATITKNYGLNGYSDLMLNEGSRNYIRMNLKNLGRLNLTLLIPHVLAWSFVAIYLITQKQAGKARLISKGIFLSFGHDLRETLRKRRMIQSTRKTSDSELFSRLVAPYPLSEVRRRFTVVSRRPAAR